jgi:hypothetical protein
MADRNPEAQFENAPDFRAALPNAGANADRVNRTHRVVRERARTIAARRSRIRSLWLPVGIFSSVLVAICIAVWMVLDEYEIVASGSQVGSYQVVVPLLWSIPVSAALLAVVWFRQSRSDAGRGGSY